MNQKLNRIRQILAALVFIAAFTGISSCVKYSFVPPSVSTVDTLHLSTDIQPIFTICSSCHSGGLSPDLRAGKSFKALTDGEYVNLPGETSKLYSKMISTGHTPRSSDIDKQKVLIWINQGAHDN